MPVALSFSPSAQTSKGVEISLSIITAWLVDFFCEGKTGIDRSIARGSYPHKCARAFGFRCAGEDQTSRRRGTRIESARLGLTDLRLSGGSGRKVHLDLESSGSRAS